MFDAEKLRKKTESQEYDFLRTNEHLGDRIVLLAVGGSVAYGTNTADSDLDLRGIALDSKRDLLGISKPFETFEDRETDTVIHTFHKAVRLLMSANPNMLEIVGFPEEDYLLLKPIGKLLIENRKLFLSKFVVNSFGGYANQQLYRLNHKAARQMGHDELEQHVLKTLEFMQTHFKDVYTDCGEDGLKLYIDESQQKEYDTEIYMDVHLTHYPLRDYCSMWNEMQTTVRQYNKLGKRNQNAMERGKIAKHAMHLIRLYMMCLDILKTGEIQTYREKEHDLLMRIRNGEYLDAQDKPVPEFFEMVAEYEKELDEASRNTDLPDVPDYKKIEDFCMSINEMIVKGEC